MKITNIINLLILLTLAACSHEPIATIPNIIPPQIIEPVKKPDPIIPPIVKEITNFDYEFQNGLKNIWGSYFIENYNESRSLDIFIATNRNFKTTNFGCTNQSFGTNLDPSPVLKIGVCRINVPKNHSTGEIEFSTDKKANSHNFFKIVNAKSYSEDFLIDYIKRTKRTPLIFVHGFNVKYQDAVLRAGQISYDLKYQGPIILFTWPSGSGDGFFDDKFLTKTYEANQKNAKQSIAAFKKFLMNFYEHEITLNIIVHSMGHQVVLDALNELGNIPTMNEHKLINELILNAPDYEVDEFQNKIDLIKKTAKRITLYCSFNDKALVASSSINKSDRMGSCANVDGIDSVNVGLIDNNAFGTGHSYYSSRAIITDVFQVLLGLDVEKRLFMKKSEPNSTEKFYLRN